MAEEILIPKHKSPSYNHSVKCSIYHPIFISYYLLFYVFSLHFFGFKLFKVTSEEGFADKGYTLLSIYLYICILSSLVKIIIAEKVGKGIDASIYSYLGRTVTLYPS